MPYQSAIDVRRRERRDRGTIGENQTIEGRFEEYPVDGEETRTRTSDEQIESEERIEGRQGEDEGGYGEVGEGEREETNGEQQED